jgi:hypothetical protein
VDSRTISTARKRQNHGRAVGYWRKTPELAPAPAIRAGKAKTSEGKGEGKRKGAEYI